MTAAFLLRHWRILALLAVLLGLSGWHFQDKISDWLDARKIAKLQAQVEALSGEVASLKESARQQEAANKAAAAARDRNDEVIPKARRESDARVAAVDGAGPADSVRLGAEAVAAYNAAADRLRGTSAR